MNTFEKEMTKYWTNETPQTYSFLGSPEEAKNVQQTHKDQIHFLDPEGTKLISELINSTGMLDKAFVQKPFVNYFSNIETLIVGEDEKALKKWLYNRGIPFSRWVYLDSDNLNQCVMMTWKMVIKYCSDIFFAHDVSISDSTLRWGLFYYHSDEMYFGKDIKYNRAEKEEIELLKNVFLKNINKF